MMASGRGNSMVVLGFSHLCQWKNLPPRKMERLSGLEIFRYPQSRLTIPFHSCRCMTSHQLVPTIVLIREAPSTSPGHHQLMKIVSAQILLDSHSLHDLLLKPHTANCDLYEPLLLPLHTIAGRRRRQRMWKLLWYNDWTSEVVVLQSRPNVVFGQPCFQAPLHDEDFSQSTKWGGLGDSDMVDSFPQS